MQPVDNSPSPVRNTSIRHLLIILSLLIASACAGNKIKTATEERSFSAYVELANSYLQQGNAASAENSLEQAAEIDDQDPRLFHAYGLLYQFRKENEEAEEMFLTALEKDPDFSQARNNYGVFLSNANRNAEALSELSKAAKDPAYPLRAVAYENMAEVALQTDNLILAAESMQNAAIQDPTQKRYFLRAAHLLYLSQAYDRGQEYFNRFLMISDSQGVEPTSEELHIGYALATARKDKATAEYLKKRLDLLNPKTFTPANNES